MAFWDIGVNISVNATNVVQQINNILTTFERLKAISASPLGNMIGPISQQAGVATTSINNLTVAVERFKASSATPLSAWTQSLNQATQSANTAALSITNLGIAAGRNTATFSASTNSIAQQGNALANLNSQLAQTQSGLSGVGNAAANTTSRMGGLREVFTGNRGLVFGFSALFGTLTGIVFELQLVQEASARVAESQAHVNDIIAQGQKGSGAYGQALQSLAKDQRFLDFSTRNLALAFTNLIPDTILIINGLLGITQKVQALTGVTGPATTAMAAMTTQMVASTTASTALNVAQTTLGTGTVVMRDAYAGVAPIMAATRTEQVALTLTADGLVASQAAVATQAIVSRDAIGTLGPVMAATRAEEGALALTNDALGASFLAMGTKAEAGGVQVAAAGQKIGGIKGMLGSLLGAGGGAGLAALGAVGFVAFADQFIKSANDVVNARLMAEKEIEDANRSLSSNSDALISKVRSGNASMSESWAAYASSVDKSAQMIIDSQNKIGAGTPVGTAGTGAPAPRAGYQPGQAAGNWAEFMASGGSQGAPGIAGITSPPAKGSVVPPAVTGLFAQQNPQAVIDLYSGQSQAMVDRFNRLGTATVAAGAAAPQAPLSFGEFMAQQRLSQQRQYLQAQVAGQVDLGPTVGQFPLKGAIGAEGFGKLQDLRGKIEETIAKKPKGEQFTPEQQANLTGYYNEILKITTATEDMKEVQDKANETLSKQNQEIGKMPQGLQDALGMHQAYTKQVEVEGQMVQATDDALQEHDAAIRRDAEGYTNHNAVVGESLQVQEQLVAVGNKVVGGVEQQAAAIQASNIFWSQMNDIIKEDIASSQELSLSSIDVTQALTNQSKGQYLVNQGMIDGKLAAQGFLEQTISGVAQNKQFHASLLQIADAMGIQIPKGMQLTSEQLQAVITDFRTTGSEAGALADIINQRIAPAVQNLGGALTAKSWDEFKKAFSELEFGDTPKNLVNKFKDFDNMIRKINEDAREMTTVFNEMDLMSSLGKLDVTTFREGLSAMREQVEHIAKLQDIDLTFIMNFLDSVKNLKDPAAFLKFYDTFKLISDLAQNGYTSQELEKIRLAIQGIKPEVFDKLSESMKKVVSTLTSADIEGLSTAAKVMLGIEEPKFKTVFDPTQKKLVNVPNADYTGDDGAGKLQSRFNVVDGKVTRGPKDGAAATTPLPDVAGVTKANQAIVASYAATTKAVSASIATMGTGVVNVINTMAKSVNGVMIALAKAVVADVAAMATGITGILFPMIKTVVATLVAFRSAVVTVFAQMNKASQTEVTALYTYTTEIFTTLSTDVQTRVEEMSSAVIEQVATMNSGVQTEVTAMYDFTTEVFTKMSEEVPKTTETMANDTMTVMKKFASDFDTEMGKVQTAAEDATAAVAALDTAVGNLDGASAKVTITTEFKTSGSPPPAATGLIDYGGVTSAAADRTITNAAFGKIITSYQGGGLETTHGPKMVIYGDNPGGVETHAFIPHDNPFPTLRKLAKLFRGRGTANDVVNSGMLGESGELVVNLESHIHQHLDSREIGVQVTKQTFRKLRTRMG